MTEKKITLRVPIYAARLLYSAIEHLLTTGTLKEFRPVLTEKLAGQLVEISDALAFEISTADGGS